ncbi:hypothetical protein FCM35_KLT10247 [Carex littledalei]|uniref:Uncharacterized protein n=1 Tax=Carex littledalei TaxID=544730 RepID=A0A833QU01_9POAL|nr:hypothetical protein FCM35_KLT10247 [Carex littledalei]
MIRTSLLQFLQFPLKISAQHPPTPPSRTQSKWLRSRVYPSPLFQVFTTRVAKKPSLASPNPTPALSLNQHLPPLLCTFSAYSGQATFPTISPRFFPLSTPPSSPTFPNPRSKVRKINEKSSDDNSAQAVRTQAGPRGAGGTWYGCSRSAF